MPAGNRQYLQPSESQGKGKAEQADSGDAGCYFTRVVGEALAPYSGRYTLSFGNKNPGTWFLNPLN